MTKSVRLSTLLVAIGMTATGVATAQLAQASTAVRKPPPPVCNLIAPKPHDVGNVVTSDPSLNIVSADVATNSATLTTVIRVKHLAASPDQLAPTGRVWQFSFFVGSSQVQTGVADGPLGQQDMVGIGAHVTIDLKNSQIRYSVPLTALISHWSVPITKGTKFTQLSVSDNAAVQVPTGVGLGYPKATGLSFDNQASTKTYTAGQRSCVKVGS
jgi:hypothetical protein